NHYRNGGPTDEVPIHATAEARAAYEQRVRELQARREKVQAALAAIERDFLARREKDQDKVRDPSAPAPPKLTPQDVAKTLLTEGSRVPDPERVELYRRLRREFAILQKQKVPGDLALGVTEAGRQSSETFVFLRGNPQARGARVEPGFPVVLGDNSPAMPTPP